MTDINGGTTQTLRQKPHEAPALDGGRYIFQTRYPAGENPNVQMERIRLGPDHHHGKERPSMADLIITDSARKPIASLDDYELDLPTAAMRTTSNSPVCHNRRPALSS